MELIREAIVMPTNNLLGIFIYLTLISICTILIVTALLYLIPNPLSRRIKNAITGTATFIILILWLYYAVFRQFY